MLCILEVEIIHDMFVVICKEQKKIKEKFWKRLINIKYRPVDISNSLVNPIIFKSYIIMLGENWCIIPPRSYEIWCPPPHFSSTKQKDTHFTDVNIKSAHKSNLLQKNKWKNVILEMEQITDARKISARPFWSILPKILCDKNFSHFEYLYLRFSSFRLWIFLLNKKRKDFIK